MTPRGVNHGLKPVQTDTQMSKTATKPNGTSPRQFGLPQKTSLNSLQAVFTSLTKLYYIVNKTNYIYTLRATVCSGVAKKLKENKQDNNKITPPSRICSEGGGLRVVSFGVSSPLHVAPSPVLVVVRFPLHVFCQHLPACVVVHHRHLHHPL